MGKTTLVFFEMKGDQFRKDITAKLKRPLRYPQLPTKSKAWKVMAGHEDPLFLRVVAEVDDDTHKKLAADSLLLDQMRKEFLPLYGKCCEAIAAAYQTANLKFAANVIDGDKAAAEALHEEAKKLQALVDQMGAAAQKVWEAHKKTHDAYGKYQIKVAATLTVATISLVAGIALTASTPFHFGVGTIFGLLGMVKSSAVIIKEVGNSLKEPIEALESAEKAFMKLFAGMEKDGKYKKTWKAKQYTAEIANTATNIALSTEMLPSLSKLKDKIKLADNKIKGVDVKMHKIGKKITEYSKRYDTYQTVTRPKLEKMIKEGDLSQGWNPIGMALHMETVNKNTELKMTHQLEKLAKVQVEYAEMKKRIDALNEALDMMLQKKAVSNLARFGEVMEFIALAGNLGMSAAGCVNFDANAAGDVANLVITGMTTDLTPEAMAGVGEIFNMATDQFTTSLA